MKSYDAFLSHNSKDKLIVERIAGRLEDEAELKVWLDEWNLVPGDPWQEGLEKALNDSRCCVVFLGPHGISPWQNEEMRDAINQRVSKKSLRVLPVLLQDAEEPDPEELPIFLQRLTWVKYREGDAKAFHHLICGIRGKKPGRFPDGGASKSSRMAFGNHQLAKNSRMPHLRNPCFVGRDDALQAMARYFWEPQPDELHHGVAIAGIGGIGKTQLACEYAYRHGNRYRDGVFWLSFAEPNLIESEIANCGNRMGLGPDFGRLNQDEQMRLVKRAWLEPGERLFIFDNCEDEALFKQWSMGIGVGHILLTSRRQKWSPSLGVKVLALGVLEPQDSAGLLIKLCENLTPKEARPIAEALGHLPLALHLAGCYLDLFWDVDSPATFLVALLDQNILDHPAMQGEGAEDQPTGHELHVAQTFALSFDKLNLATVRGQYARKLLCRAACFAPGEPIPRKLLLKTLQAEEAQEKRRGALGLKRLIDFGLLAEVDRENLSLHRLLVAFIKKTIVGQTFAEGQKAVENTFFEEAAQLNKTGDPRPLSLWSSHLKWVTDQSDMNNELAAGLCNEFGYHSGMVGAYATTIPYYEKALAICTQVLGEAHPDTALSLNNLGGLLQAMGELAAAKPYLEQALAIRKQVLGEAHPDMAQSLNNIGALLQAMGELDAAKAYFEQALAIRKQVLGEDHADRAQSLNNLGALLLAMGELDAAKAYFEKALAIRKQVLGEVHSSTVISYWSLLLFFDESGDSDSVNELIPQLLWLLEASDEDLSADHRTVRDRFAKWLELRRGKPDTETD